jgi:hypothetical protein
MPATEPSEAARRRNPWFPVENRSQSDPGVENHHDAAAGDRREIGRAPLI